MRKLPTFVREQVPAAYRLAREIRNRYLCHAVKGIVARTTPPDVQRPMRAFAQLLEQSRRREFTPYGFNDFENWVRAAERALWLVKNLPPLQTAGARVLEVGAGDGMLGKLLAGYGHDIVLADYEDWRDRRAKDLPFLLGKIELGLNTSDSFDVIVSCDAFEHFEDPAKCVAVLGKLLRPNGVIHLDFGPLFASPFGMHCHTLLPIPYCQFLLEESFVLDQIRQHGHYDLGREMQSLQPMNRWRLEQFDTAWSCAGCRPLSREIFHEYAFLSLVRRYPESFSGRALKVEDLTAVRIRVTLTRHSGTQPL